MPLLECIIECVRVCFKCRRNCVYLCKPVSVCVRERGEWASEVCVTLYSMRFSKTTGGETILKRHQLNDGEWFLSHHWAEQTHDTTWTRHAFLSLWKQRINMDATNERVGLFIAFCVFDLQINWPQFTLMRFAPHNLTRFQSQALILAVVLSACGAVPIPFCCRTHDRDLLILITAVILLLGAVLPVAWHTHTHKTDATRLNSERPW